MMDLRERIESFLSGDGQRLCVGGEVRSARTRLIFPGSFAPLHRGHLEMAQRATARYGVPVEFELSVSNVDKPALTGDAVLERLIPFGDEHPIWLTKAPTFAQKASLFPSTTFLIGADTVCRLVDRKYYLDEQDFQQAMEHIVNAGCRFLAFGRLVDSIFASKELISLPAVLSDIVEFVPESEFRCDLSSTDIRSQRNSNPT